MFFYNIKYWLNPKNRHDRKIEKQFYREIAKIGYGRKYRRYQISCKTFAPTDTAVIPVIIKYLDLFEQEGYRMAFTSALGVKGFYEASEYLIGEYKKNMPPDYNERTLNVISQTLARICDLRYVDEYIDFLSDNVSFEAGYLVEMLGNMMVEKAVPTIIKLLDCVAIIPQKWHDNILEDQKFYVSQCAIKALGKFKDSSLIQYLEKFLEPEKIDWIKFDCADNNKYLKRIYREYKELATKAIEKLKK